MATNIHTHPGMHARDWDDKAHHIHSGITKAVAWISLLTSIFAVVLAVSAYNRAGQDLQAVVGNQLEETRQDARLLAARTEARTRLLALQAQIAAGQATDETRAEIRAIRADLAEAYGNTTGEVRQGWMQMDAGLDRLEQQTRNNTADAIGTLEGILRDLRRDVRIDEDRE